MKKSEIFALSEIKGVGPRAVLEIIKVLDLLSCDSVKDVDINELLGSKGLSRYKKILKENLQENVFSNYEDAAQEKIDNIEKKGISIIGIDDNKYPWLLKLIPDPPTLLFYKGNDSLFDEMSAAVVGTRKNTALGERITRKTVDFLCENKFTVVSGLANGIDAIAHDQALTNMGNTVSVLVDVEVIHPKSNQTLADRILSNRGLLVSEIPPGTPIIPPLFAKRDRIQSGLSLAVFAIETTINGGTRHAVENAEKQNRLVYSPDVTKSGYVDVSIPQLEGVTQFINKKIAKPYTKEKYIDLVDEMTRKSNELSNASRIVR